MIQEAYIHGISTRSVDDLVKTLVSVRSSRPTADRRGRLRFSRHHIVGCEQSSGPVLGRTSEHAQADLSIVQ